MATIAELNILFKAKGLQQVTSGVDELNSAVKRTKQSSDETRKSVANFDRGLRDLSSGLRSVQQLSSFVAVTLGGPLIGAAIQASKTNIQLADAFRDVKNAGTDLTNSIGQSLVPVAQDVAKVVRKMTDEWLKLPQATRDSLIENSAWAVGIAAITGTVARFTRAIIGLIRAIIRLGGLKEFGLLAGGALGGASLVGGFAIEKQIQSALKSANPQAALLTIVKDVVAAFFNPASIGVKSGLGVMGGITGKKAPGSLADSGISGLGGVIDLGSVSTSAQSAGEALSPFKKAIQDIKREVDMTFGELAVKLPTLGQTVATTLKTMFDGFTNGIGQAVAQSIVYGENFGQAFMNVMKQVAAQTIAFLVTTIAKVIALRALGVVGPISSFALGLGGGSGGGGGGSTGGSKQGFIGSLTGLPLPFAEGGIVTKPTVGLVGEAGPEAVIPLDEMGSMGGGVTVHFNGHTFLDDESAIDKLVRKISSAQKRVTQRRTGGTSLAV